MLPDLLRRNTILNKEAEIEIFFVKIISFIALLDFTILIADFKAFWGENSIIPFELGLVNSLSFAYLHWVSYYFSGTMLTYFFYGVGFIYIILLFIQIFRTKLLLSFPIICFQLILYRSIVHFNYGYDQFITISFFYAFCLGLCRLFKNDSKPHTSTRITSLALILRIHLCIVYFFSGIAKAAGVGWWNGNSLYRALASFKTELIFPPSFLAIAGIGIIFLETLYPILIYTKFRKWTVLAIICMHILIGIFMKLPFFALIMITWNVFAHPDLFISYFNKKYFFLLMKDRKKLSDNTEMVYE